MTVPDLLHGFVGPDEDDAQERAWESVLTAHRQRLITRRRRHRLALVIPVLPALLTAIALTPAGATVRHWLGHALGLPQPAAAALALPSPGRLLVAGPHGTWTVAHNGAIRRLGPWTNAVWSPHGRYLLVAEPNGNGVAAVDRAGAVQWALERRAVTDLAWYGPSGYRVGYRSGSALRTAAGDGNGDHLLAQSTAAIAPAWRPGHPYQLAYLTSGGRLVVRDADSKAVIWTARAPGSRVLQLDWSANGARLLEVARNGASVYAGDGRLLRTIHTEVRSGALAPDGQTLALVRNAGALVVGTTGGPLRPVMDGAALGDPTFSPDGRWLVLTWPAAREWLFLRIIGTPEILAVQRVNRRFGPGASITGWCCGGR